MPVEAVLLEAIMLLCFGIAWPVANLRMLRTRRTEGKGLAFTLIILLGYVAGAAAKGLSAAPGQPMPGLFWLYAVNGLSVLVNLTLQWYFGRHVAVGPAPAAPQVGGASARMPRRQAGGLRPARPPAPCAAPAAR